MISQGGVYWADLPAATDSGPALARPVIVIQNDAMNASRIQTVIVCILTTNLMRAGAPGNVLLDDGEANLKRRSVVNVSQVFTLDRDKLREHIGTVSSKRMLQVVRGITLVIEPREVNR